MTLTIPPGSVESDVEIGIRPLSSIPQGHVDHFQDFGQAYKFTPEGTQFALAKPAVLSIRYDAAKVEARGLSQATLQLYYFDEALGRYINVPSRVDTALHTITANIEHFTVYLPVGKPLMPGNNPPSVGIQATVPGSPRAEAPIYVRATVTDYDPGGSLAGARLYYCKLSASACTSPADFTQAWMTRDPTPANADTYGYIIPSSFLTAADLLAGNDLRYFVEAIDNFDVSQTSAYVDVNVARAYLPGSLVLGPATIPGIAAGFSRTLVARGTDSGGFSFTLVPEAVSTTGIGLATNQYNSGILFEARAAGAGSVTARFGAQSASAPVTVFNGQLSEIKIFGGPGAPAPIPGTLNVKEGSLVKLYARGFDAYGNYVNIYPTWTTSPGIGSISSVLDPLGNWLTGTLDTLDGSGSGQVLASLGSRSSAQWINILPRAWTSIGGTLENNHDNAGYSSITAIGATPYVVWEERYYGISPSTYQVYVKHWNGSTWIQDGGMLNVLGSSSFAGGQIGSDGIAPWVAIMESPNPNVPFSFKVYVKRLENGSWVQKGSSLNLDTSRSAESPSIAFAGPVPYLAWKENDAGGVYQLYVKRWDATSSTWSQVGASLNVNSARNVSYLNIQVDSAGTPYVAWTEESGSAIHQVYVKHWNGAAWVQDGGSLNVDPTRDAHLGGGPVVGICNGIPYVYFQETNGATYQAYVKHWNGAGWVQDGASLNISPAKHAYNGTLSCLGPVPYVAKSEYVAGATDNDMVVQHWNGLAWIRNPGAFTNNTFGVGMPSIAFIGNAPWVTYSQGIPGGNLETRVKALQ